VRFGTQLAVCPHPRTVVAGDPGAEEHLVDMMVTNAPDQHRYEAYAGDVLAGFAQYTVEGGTVVLTHTEVDPRFEGEGVGSTLIRDALDDIRRQGLEVVPQCPFVAAYIEKHPDEYGELVARRAEG
jgi:predicted GNAT family acetyltransferase